MQIKKRLFSSLLAFLTLSSALILGGAEKSDFQYSSLDVSGDGCVSSFDTLYLLQYLSGKRELDENQLKKADINADGKVNSADALALMRIVTYKDIYKEPENSSSSSTESSSSSSSQPDEDPDFLANGVDVSKWQGDSIDWNKVKNAGYDFAIVRVGYGRYSDQKDACFEVNYANAKAAGLDVGAYHFSYARTVAEAETEAQVCLEWLEGKSFEYPIFFDVESQTDLGAELTSQIIDAFCSKLEAKGYYVGIYSYANYFHNYVNDDILEKYPVWVAHHNVSAPNFSGHDIWQYTDTGSVNGIGGDVDLNYCYTDFEAYIKSNNLNGF